MTTELKPLGFTVDWIRDTELVEVPEYARILLEDYAGIPVEDQIVHINRIVSRTPQPLSSRLDILTNPLARSSLGHRESVHDLHLQELTRQRSIPTLVLVTIAS